jgi:MoxR-vWA-beta-propeller ternary system protein
MLAPFLETLFDEGDVTFTAAPQSPPPDRKDAERVLARAFGDYRLEIAGPLIEYDAITALAAAEFVRWACWFLVHRDSAAEEVRRHMQPLPAPATPPQHLAADLTFHYLPLLYRRARALSPDDVLTQTLTLALRTWPLAGVASDLDAAPAAPVDFSGHPGLELLYAERYARHPRANWLPPGRVAEYVEWIATSECKKK